MKTLGKYEKLDVLGNGVSGIVYLAKDTLLNRQVALKEVDVQAGDVARFLEEARVIDRLRHPNIVRVHGVDRIENKIVIDMEYVRGQNLQELLRGEGILSIDRALDITDQVLDALAYAHSQQTVHRDIKPANILIGRDGVVKLVDFGLAEILATNAYAGGAGTYAYMAPEDFAAEDHSDHQSDLWAVGVTLYEMLSLARPFQVLRVKDPFSWKRALETEEAIPLSEVLPEAPISLTAVLNRALTKDKRKRYPTADAFRDDILSLRSKQKLPEETLAFASVKPTSRPSRSEPELERTVPHWNPHTLPGVVVADVGKAASPLFRSREEGGDVTNPLLSMSNTESGRITVEPSAIDFGDVRPGETRETKVRVKVMGEGVKGRVIGSVRKKADWLSVNPVSFDRLKQAVTVTVKPERAKGIGLFEDQVLITTEHGTVSVPVQMRVHKARASFGATALWFIPLFLATLLPAIVVSGVSQEARWLIPPAALASGLLALMLLLVTVGADTGAAERISCGFLIAVMCFVLGASLSKPVPSTSSHTMMHAASYLLMVGVVLGASGLLQAMSLRSWKFWGVALVGLSVLISSALVRAVG